MLVRNIYLGLEIQSVDLIFDEDLDSISIDRDSLKTEFGNAEVESVSISSDTPSITIKGKFGWITGVKVFDKKTECVHVFAFNGQLSTMATLTKKVHDKLKHDEFIIYWVNHRRVYSE